MMKIGIMGGTFDPIHNGHLIISEYIRDYLDLDQVIFIPAGQPPHKDNERVTLSSHRFNMTKLAIQSNEYFNISDMEIKNKEFSYTVNTIKKLKEADSRSEFYFIIGSDSLFTLEKWYSFQELAKITKFALWERAGYSSEEALDRIEYLKDRYDARVIYIEGPIIEISSSQIRSRIKSNRSIKYLVPDSVLKYVEKYNLYTGE